MSIEPPSLVVEKLVQMANANPSAYVCVAPSGDFCVVQAEIPVDDGQGGYDLKWLDYDDDHTGLPSDGVKLQKYVGAEWVVGPTGMREGIWPHPLHEALRKAYEVYSLFGIGDGHGLV
jgi:hypothetical protein